MNPLCELSLMVMVNNGPGIIAPESAMTKDDKKTVANVVSTAKLISFCRSPWPVASPC